MCVNKHDASVGRLSLVLLAVLTQYTCLCDFLMRYSGYLLGLALSCVTRLGADSLCRGPIYQEGGHMYSCTAEKMKIVS